MKYTLVMRGHSRYPEHGKKGDTFVQYQLKLHITRNVG